jgi:hypothetical protein
MLGEPLFTLDEIDGYLVDIDLRAARSLLREIETNPSGVWSHLEDVEIHRRR